MAINRFSAFHLIKTVIPNDENTLVERTSNIASTHYLSLRLFNSVYVVDAKHGVLGLSKTVAIKFPEHGITCNNISPENVARDVIASASST